MPTVYEGTFATPAGRFALIAARFNHFIVEQLVNGALDSLKRHGVADEAIDLVWVPGSFETPLIAQRLAASGKYAAVICLGAIIRGDTDHYDYVAGEAAKDQDRQKQHGAGKASHAVQNSSRRPRAQVTIRTVSKTATRRAPGRSAEDLQASVERFLKASRKPALLEPGEPIIPITGANLLLEVRNSRFTVQAWDDERNVVRRVIAIQEETRGRLELVAERFAGKRGALYLIDLARATGADWERRGTRMVFREQFRQFLSREFPAWRIAELSTERDLEHSLSPAYPRALLKRGGAALAAIGSPPDGFSSSGVLSFGLIWLDYVRRRERRTVIEADTIRIIRLFRFRSNRAD